MDVAKLQAVISADTGPLEAGLGKAHGLLTNFGSGLEAVGKLAFTGVVAGTAGLVAGLGFATKSAGDLQQSVANISTIKPTVDTSQVFGALNDLQTRVPQSAAALGDALYNVFSSIDVSQAGALQLTEQFAKSAVGAQTDAQTFGTSVLGVMNAYKLSVEDASHISDVFFNTVNAGVITGQELASSLGPVTQSAKAAGVELDTLGGLLVGVTKEGGPAVQNVNNLNNFLQKLTTNEAVAGFKALGVATTDTAGHFRAVPAVLEDLKAHLAGLTEAEKAAALQKIFPDAQARQGAQTLISQLDNVNAAIETNKGQAGSAEAAYVKMSATFNSQVKLLGNSVNSVANTLGAELLPSITPVIAAFSAQLPAAFASARAALGPLLADLGPKVGASFGLVRDAVGTVQQVFAQDWGADSSINPVVAAVGNLALVVRDQVLPAIQSFATIAGAAFEQAFSFVVANGEAIKGALLGIGAGLAVLATVGGIAAVGAAIAAIVTPVGLVVAAVGLLGAAWSTNFGDIQGKTAAAWSVIQPILSGIGDAISTAWSIAQPALAALGEGLGQIGAAFDAGGIGGALGALGGLVADGLSALVGLAAQALAPLGEAIGGFFSGLGTIVSGALGQLGALISTAWTGYIDLTLAPLRLLQAGVMAIWDAIPVDITANLTLIATTLADRLAAMASLAVEGWGILATAAATGWATITSTISTALSGILSVVGTWVSDVVAKVTELGTLALQGAGIVGDNIVAPITAKIGEVLSAVGTWVGEVVGKISSLAGTMLTEAGKVGQAIVDGIGNALIAGLGWIGEQASNLARQAISAAKAALGIESPSTVFAAIGTQVAAGLAQGIGAGGGLVTDSVQAIINAAIANGIAPLHLLALAQAESGLNPKASNTNGEDSHGLFQHNRAGGQGSGLSVAQLENPTFSANKFAADHAALYKQLVAEGLAGEALVKTFGRLAEGSDPRFAERYAVALREVTAQFGATARGSAQLGAVQQQGTTWAQTMAEQQAALTQVLQGQAPAMRNTKEAMAAFGSVLGPIERQVAGGSIGLETLQFKLIDLARATGLATEPWDRFAAGTITADEAMTQVINSAADASPAFDELRKYQDTAGSSSREAALRFLQLALAYQQGGKDIAAVGTEVGKTSADMMKALFATPSAAGGWDPLTPGAAASKALAGPIAAQVASFDQLRPTIDAARESLRTYTNYLFELTDVRQQEQVKGWDSVGVSIGKAAAGLHSLADFLDGHEFHVKINVDEIPWWAVPGSPTPLENGLRGIMRANTELRSSFGSSLRGLASPLAASSSVGLPRDLPIAAGAGGGGSQVVVHNHYDITVQGNIATEGQFIERFHAGLLQKKRINGRLGLGD